jgi:hypothetical protein
MAPEARRVELSELAEEQAWLDLVENVRSTQRPAILSAAGDDVAEIRPVSKRQRRSRAGLRRDDALWELVGIVGPDEGPGDVSANKHAYLAEAYSPQPR